MKKTQFVIPKKEDSQTVPKAEPKVSLAFKVMLVWILLIPILLIVNAGVERDRLAQNSGNYEAIVKCEEILKGVKTNLHEDSNALRGK